VGDFDEARLTEGAIVCGVLALHGAKLVVGITCDSLQAAPAMVTGLLLISFSSVNSEALISAKIRRN
jgi:hypothetical protein